VSESADPGDGRPRRRTSWSLRSIVEEVGGHPISDYQDPARPVHPYVRLVSRLPPSAPAATARPGARAPPRADPIPTQDAAARPGPEELPEPDPVARFYPPLTGATARELHGPEHEHHRETLEGLRGEPEAPAPGVRPHPPGPSRRPERIYLHYLLLHLDQLSDHALRYLGHAVKEELEHRSAAAAAPPAPPSR
jgi:hypothetical protein